MSNKLLDASAALKAAAEALAATNDHLQEQQSLLDDLESRTRKNNEFRRKLYELLREYEEY